MSQHLSFGGKGKLKVGRNVKKRYERLRHLKKKGKWEEGQSIFGLPKTQIEE